MDRFFKALLVGFMLTVLFKAFTASAGKDEGTQEQMLLFPQLSISAAADKDCCENDGEEGGEIVYAFRISEIIDSIAARYHSI